MIEGITLGSWSVILSHSLRRRGGGFLRAKGWPESKGMKVVIIADQQQFGPAPIRLGFRANEDERTTF